MQCRISERGTLLLELIGLGHSDADYSVLERGFVTTVARAMGLDPEIV